jgi:fumarate reductase flavoprotein subunit
LFEKGAILINRSGRRFCLESDRPAYALPDQPDGAAYILLDRRLADMFSVWPHYISTAPGIAYAYLPDYRASRPDIYTEAKTLDDLSRRLGIDAKTLKATVNDCNAGRVNSDMPLLAEPPFTALGPVRAVFVHNEGGLAVDACHRVLDASDRPIPGLYAAGSTGQGGLLLKGHGHHLAWAFVSGRRAGCFAAFAATSPSAP